MSELDRELEAARAARESDRTEREAAIAAATQRVAVAVTEFLRRMDAAGRPGLETIDAQVRWVRRRTGLFKRTEHREQFNVRKGWRVQPSATPFEAVDTTGLWHWSVDVSSAAAPAARDHHQATFESYLAGMLWQSGWTEGANSYADALIAALARVMSENGL